MNQQLLLTRISTEHEGALLSAWGWLVPSDYRPLYSTIFGDLFLRTSSSDTIFFLNTLDGGLIDAADDEADLYKQFESEELRNEILMPSLVEAIGKRLGPPPPGCCYSAIVPPCMGGLYEPSNFHVLTLNEHLSALGTIQQQVANDPPGTRYRPVRDAG